MYKIDCILEGMQIYMNLIDVIVSGDVHGTFEQCLRSISAFLAVGVILFMGNSGMLNPNLMSNLTFKFAVYEISFVYSNQLQHCQNLTKISHYK